MLIFAGTALAVIALMLIGSQNGLSLQIFIPSEAGPSRPRPTTRSEFAYAAIYLAVIAGSLATVAFWIVQLGRRLFRRRGPWG